MAPAVGPLRARVLRDERHRIGIASGKVAASPRLAGKQGKALWIAFAGGEGIAKADHQTVLWRNGYARLRSVRRGPRDGHLTGDRPRLARNGGNDDADLAAIAGDRCRSRLKRTLRRVDELPGVGRIGEDGAGEAPLARLPGRRVGIKDADNPSGRPHIVAPDRAAVVQPLDRVPACLGRPRQGGFSGERSRTRRLAQPRRSSSFGPTGGGRPSSRLRCSTSS